MILPGFTGSSHISISVEPDVSQSTITLSSVYQLDLLPLFDRFGRYTCEIPLSVPTRNGSYTSKVSLECSYVPRDAEVILGSDWISNSSAAFCDDGSGLEDPPMSVTLSLPVGHYWTPNDDVQTLDNDSTDIDTMLFQMNSCCNDPIFDAPAFFAAHGMESDEVPLTREDVLSHFLNGQCASRKAPGCYEVARAVTSPVKISLMITEAIVVRCGRKQIPLSDLRVYCSAIGVTTTKRPEHTFLSQKLKTRCNTLRPLLNCDGLETTLSGIENLGKHSLQHLSAQHEVKIDPENDIDSARTSVVDHITSGGCQASSSSLCISIDNEYRESDAGANNDLETYILQLAAKKTKLTKKELRRVLKSKGIEFDNSEGIGELRRRLRSYITALRKGKQSQWSRTQRAESEFERRRHLNKIREEWPQPASMNLKENCPPLQRACASSLVPVVLKA
ncbi:hypothetical protein BJ322DRAFT_1217792 [Thelephora terrestris]|uniref:Uncharacterized protein n=1 Tax=Thelephora terrestris TaxID=56493 RepID=A0A9P6HGL0_9AGAM|nr:hypothetical protein BJ322DRAFT_1217792 [Thelephora terrestris]